MVDNAEISALRHLKAGLVGAPLLRPADRDSVASEPAASSCVAQTEEIEFVWSGFGSSRLESLQELFVE